MKSVVIIFTYLLTFFFFTNTSFAQVVINEVQIAPITERFIELYNAGDLDIDLTSWYIQRKTATGSSFNSLVTKTDFENKTIVAGGYFLISRAALASPDIIKDNLTLTEFNTLRMRNSEGEDVNEVEMGSIPEGESYQRTSSGKWTFSIPTPGNSNSGVVSLGKSSSDDGGGSDDIETSEQSQLSPPVATGASSWPVEPQIFTRIKDAPKVAVVGADVLLEGDTLGLKKEPLKGARYLWTLGDGGTKEGQKILYHYNYPGKYIVVLNTSSGMYSSSDRVVIEAIPSEIKISSVGVEGNSFVEISNETKYELNISWWRLRAGGKIFTIPKDTIVLPENKIIFPSQYTKFETKTGDSVELLYPNGVVATFYFWEPDIQIVQIPQVIKVNTPKASIPFAKDGPLQVDDIEKEDGEELDVEIITEDQTANVFTATDGSGNIYKYLLGVTGISALAIFGVLLTRKERFTEVVSEADEYEIIEE